MSRKPSQLKQGGATSGISKFTGESNEEAIHLRKIDSLGRRNFDRGSHEENPRRGEGDHIVQRPIAHIDDLEDVPGAGAEEIRVLDDEELLLLGGPHHPPRTGEGGSGRDQATTEFAEGRDGGDDLGPLRRVGLGAEAPVLVGDEGEEVGLGFEGGGSAGEGLGRRRVSNATRIGPAEAKGEDVVKRVGHRRCHGHEDNQR